MYTRMDLVFSGFELRARQARRMHKAKSAVAMLVDLTHSADLTFARPRLSVFGVRSLYQKLASFSQTPCH